MKVLELFAGSRSVGQVAERLGCEVFSVDWQNYEGVNLVIDIEQITPTDIPFIPDFVWLSPDCKTYSVAAMYHHRNGVLPKTEYAEKCDRVNVAALKLVNYFLEKNPRLIFYQENPRGMMRKMPFVSGLPRTTVWYCTYGHKQAKPTDIWSNNLFSLFNTSGWIGRPECFNGNRSCHHEPAPKGSNQGTQKSNSAYNRSKIPESLCIEIITNAMQRFAPPTH